MQPGDRETQVTRQQETQGPEEVTIHQLPRTMMTRMKTQETRENRKVPMT